MRKLSNGFYIIVNKSEKRMAIMEVVNEEDVVYTTRKPHCTVEKMIADLNSGVWKISEKIKLPRVF